MLTSSGYNAISSIAPPKVYRTKAGRDARAQIAVGANNYDSFTLSSPNQDRRFLGLVSRLSQEIRTTTTTGDIAALHHQVESGQYSPDPMSIAARMLFLGEEQ